MERIGGRLVDCEEEEMPFSQGDAAIGAIVVILILVLAIVVLPYLGGQRQG